MNNLISDSEQSIQILKEGGKQTIKELANALNVTTEGARFQLLKLAKEGLVKSETRSKGRGRPQQIWSLTKKGHARFPDTHSELTLKIIEKIRENLGENALDEVIASTGKDNISKYKQIIADEDQLEDKIRKLSKIREQEGYMASYQRNEDGSFLLVENHCPICSAAKVCQGFCKAELNTFQEVLGENIQIKRTDHILSGARRCAYLIKKG